MYKYYISTGRFDEDYMGCELLHEKYFDEQEFKEICINTINKCNEQEDNDIECVANILMNEYGFIEPEKPILNFSYNYDFYTKEWDYYVW